MVLFIFSLHARVLCADSVLRAATVAIAKIRNQALARGPSKIRQGLGQVGPGAVLSDTTDRNREGTNWPEQVREKRGQAALDRRKRNQSGS